MALRYIAGYGCAGAAKPCAGAPVVTVVLVDATTMSDLATVWTSPPLGNYSYGQFKGYSPPIVVDVRGLNVSNANPVLVQLRIANNKRNLQLQLAAKTGLDLNVSWTKQAYDRGNGTGCGDDCVQGTLTTDKCGLPRRLIQPLGIGGGVARVGTLWQPAFLWADGYQTAFTDDFGESNALMVTGTGAGMNSTVDIPPSAAGVVVRYYLGASARGPSVILHSHFLSL